MMPITLPTTESLFNLLKPALGNVPVRGVVVSAPTGQAVLVSGQKIPLPNKTALSLGQAVEVLIQSQGTSERTISIRPLPSTANHVANESKPANPLLQTITRLLPEISPGNLTSPTRIQHLIPSAIPVHDSAVRVLLALFHQQDSIGTIGSVILQLLGKAEEEGVLESGKWGSIRRGMPQLEIKSTGDFTQLIKQAISNSNKTPEHILAQVLQQKGAVDVSRESLTSQIRGLLKLPELKQFLKKTGEWKTFVQQSQGLLDILDGTQLANVRGMNYPYIFMELPMPGDSVIQRAQLHVLNHSKGSGDEEENKVDSIVLDLNTTMLGEMWVRLQRVGETCQCQIQLTRSEAISVVSKGREKLQVALQQHGYSEVSVSVEPMKKSRIENLIQLLGQSTQLDLQV